MEAEQEAEETPADAGVERDGGGVGLQEGLEDVGPGFVAAVRGDLCPGECVIGCEERVGAVLHCGGIDVGVDAPADCQVGTMARYEPDYDEEREGCVA